MGGWSVEETESKSPGFWSVAPARQNHEQELLALLSALQHRPLSSKHQVLLPGVLEAPLSG
jgi:hypothetical protein